MRKKVKLSSSLEELFEKLEDSAKNVCLLNGEVKGGWLSKLAWNPAESFHLYDFKKIEDLYTFIEANRQHSRFIAGFLSYDLGYSLHNIKKKSGDKDVFPLASFFAYDNYLEKENGGFTAYYTDTKFIENLKKVDRRVVNKTTSNPSPDFSTTLSKNSYKKAFKLAKKYIYDGLIYQINLTQRLESNSNLKPRQIFRNLSKKNSAKMKAYLENGFFEIISLSPERFIRTKGNIIETCPIKGTRPRGKNSVEDKNNESELLKDPKEKAELSMITDLLRNDLGKVCEPGTVTVAKERSVEKMTSVMHTFSVIKGRLRTDVTPFQALISMFPGGSITGCPKRKAIEIIDELEYSARGSYCGSLVTIDRDGDLDSSILIRTVLKQGKQLSLSVGSGIVYDSEVEKEYQENLDKVKSFSLTD